MVEVTGLEPTANFNSHAHVERDTDRVSILELRGISTHTLTWSVTRANTSLTGSQQFQLTRSRGA